MKIADFFVKIGIDGAGDVSKGLGKVSGSLKELFSMSIQTKLTLAGIAAGLTGAAFNAGKTGAALNAFSKGFGLSAQELQRWQMAAEEFKVSGEEMMGTIKALQDAISEARYKGEYNPIFSSMGIDPREMKDAFEFANTLRQRIQSSNLDAARIFSTGLISENVFQAFRQMGDPSKMAPVRKILSDKEIQEMQKISVAFDRFGKDLSRDMEKFIVQNSALIKDVMDLLKTFLKEGLTLIRDISKIFGTKYEGKENELKNLEKMAKTPYDKLNMAEKIDPFRFGVKAGDFIFHDILRFPRENKPNIEPTSSLRGKFNPETVEMQQGNTIIQIDYADFTNSNSKAEFASDAKMLATHRAVKGGS